MNRSWVLVALLAASIDCGARDEMLDRTRRDELVVQVENRNWADMRVYLERGGMRAVLGVVTSGSTERFVAPSDMTAPGAPLRLIGDPIGSRLVFASESFQADPGQTVEWTIRVNPAQSGVTVH